MGKGKSAEFSDIMVIICLNWKVSYRFIYSICIIPGEIADES